MITNKEKKGGDRTSKYWLQKVVAGGVGNQAAKAFRDERGEQCICVGDMRKGSEMLYGSSGPWSNPRWMLMRPAEARGLW